MTWLLRSIFGFSEPPRSCWLPGRGAISCYAEARRRAKEAKRERNRRIREEKERRARKKAAKEAKRAAAAAAAS